VKAFAEADIYWNKPFCEAFSSCGNGRSTGFSPFDSMIFADFVLDACFESLWIGGWWFDAIHNGLLICGSTYSEDCRSRDKSEGIDPKKRGVYLSTARRTERHRASS